MGYIKSMSNGTILTIPKSVTGREELVILPRKEFEQLLKAKDGINEENVLKWSTEAKQLKKSRKLSVLKSLKSLR